MIKIRDAKIEDAIKLAEAERIIASTPGFLASEPSEIKTEAFENKILQLSQISNGKYIVAEKDGSIVGHALLDPMALASIEHVVRLTIAVHQGHEEKSIGEQMLRYLIEWTRTAPNVEKIELNVRAVNLRAIRLYQKMGFNIEGRVRNRVRLSATHFTDDLLMGLFVKELHPVPSVVSLAIGKVVSSRKEAIDDKWDHIESHIELDANQFSIEAFTGLESFSHVEVIFYMDQVDVRKIETSARHPRNNPDLPKVGIFAQRGKNRPNQIGSTICRIKKVNGLKLYLEGLDAIDGTPVLDIKPWFKEFGPRSEIFQPNWASELMNGYWG